MKTQQKGFTLIELIIVIVVLGILAVTAAPQFFNFSSDARESTVKGMEGSVKAASALVYAKALLNPSSITEVEIDQFGTKVALTADTQYAAAIVPDDNTPPGFTPGITAALDMSDFDARLAAAADAGNGNGSDTVATGDLLIFPKGIAAEDACYVVYRAAVAKDDSATPPVVGVAPVIFSVTNGC